MSKPKMTGLQIAEVLPLNNPFVFAFYQWQAKKNYADPDMIGAMLLLARHNFDLNIIAQLSDQELKREYYERIHDLIELIDEKDLKTPPPPAYKLIEPIDEKGEPKPVWLAPNHATILEGRKGYTEVYSDPTKRDKAGVLSPAHSFVAYFGVEQEEDGNLKKHLCLTYSGMAANIVIIYRNSCCSEYSIAIDAITPNGVILKNIDGMNTMNTCSSRFIDGNGESKIVRVPFTESETKFVLKENPNVAQNLGIIMDDFGHALQHAAGIKHDCSQGHHHGSRPNGLHRN